MNQELSHDKIIAKTLWTIFGVLTLNLQGREFVNANDIFEEIGGLAYIKGITIEEINHILNLTSSKCGCLFRYLSKNNEIIGYNVYRYPKYSTIIE